MQHPSQPAVYADSHGNRPPALVIANPQAGRRRTGRELEAIVARLRAAVGPMDIVPTHRRGDAEAQAARAVEERRQLVVCVGGDGTVSEVVNGLLGDGDTALAAADGLPHLGIVATGTGCDIGRGLGIEPGVVAHVDAIAHGSIRTLDVGWARFASPSGRPMRRLWLNVLSAGIGGYVDEYVAQAPVALPGMLAYAQATLRAIAHCDRKPLRCRVTLPDGSVRERTLHAYAVAICNGTTFGAGMRIAPMARPDDGLLDVVFIETPSKLHLIRRLRTLYFGEHLREPGVSHIRCHSLALTPIQSSAATRLFPLDIDGEAFGDVPLTAGLMPRSLRVCAPATGR